MAPTINNNADRDNEEVNMENGEDTEDRDTMGVGMRVVRLTRPVVRSIIPSLTRNNPMAERPRVVFVLGAPGAGKGTQCDRIVSDFGYVHLSAGDLLREERKRKGSEFGELIEEYIQQGKIVPVEITCKLLENAMVESGSDKFLIDGFPRNQDNLDGWARTMSEKVNLQFVLFLECTQQMCIERCLNRGAAGSGRSDDNEESLKKRFSTYMNETMPIIKHYEALGLVQSIDATSPADDVFEKVRALFNQVNNATV